MKRSLVLIAAIMFVLVCISAACAELTVVSTYPPTGTKDVDPNTTQLRIRFSDSVSPNGYSLVTTDKGEPIQTDGKPSFAEDGTLCIWNIHLYPGLTYAMSINHEKFKGFRSAADLNVAVTPYFLTFTTSGVKPTGKDAEVTVLSTFPANGAKDIDPLTPSIRVRFSGPVSSNGWSFLASDLGKELPTSGYPSFLEGNTVCEQPVNLEPNATYAVSINGEKEKDFKSAKNPDYAVTPCVLVFTTGKGEPAEVIFSGPAGGICGAPGSDLRFNLVGPGKIKIYWLKASNRFRVYGTVKVVQTGQTCKNGWIDKDGKVTMTEE